MDAVSFFGLQASDDPCTWRLPVEPGVCSGLGALFGGVGLGASIEVLERVTHRPCVWATAQFLAFAPRDTVVHLEAVEIVRGHQSSQARVVARLDGHEIFTVSAALGERTDRHRGTWERPPDVPLPDDCRVRPIPPWAEDTIMQRLDTRLANAKSFEELPGPPGDGTASLWVRVPDLPVSAALLGIVGDYVPFGIAQTLGQRTGGNSLDNTLRVAHRVPATEQARAEGWVLADIRVHAIADGFGHGLVHLWGEDGTLLGTASQSTIVRDHTAERDAVERSATARANQSVIEGGH